MNKLFEKLHEKEELPVSLKSEVMQSYDMVKLITDISDLFTNKFFKSTAVFLSGEDTSEKTDSIENDDDTK
ncbi:MAG: hypothetical protein AAGI07_02350 [Bacteroidota bacterium]